MGWEQKGHGLIKGFDFVGVSIFLIYMCQDRDGNL